MDACLQILGLPKQFTLEQLDEALANRLLGATDLQKQTIYNAYRIILNSINQSKTLIKHNKFINDELKISGTLVGFTKKKYKLIKGLAKGKISYIYTPETILEIVYANTISYYVNSADDYEKSVYKAKYKNQIAILEEKYKMLESNKKKDIFKKLNSFAIRYCIGFIQMKLEEIEKDNDEINIEEEKFDLGKYKKLRFFKESLEYQKHLEFGEPRLQKLNVYTKKEV